MPFFFACTRAITVPWSVPPSGAAREPSGPGGSLWCCRFPLPFTKPQQTAHGTSSIVPSRGCRRAFGGFPDDPTIRSGRHGIPRVVLEHLRTDAVSPVYAVYAISSLDTGSPLRHRRSNAVGTVYAVYAVSSLDTGKRQDGAIS